MAKRHKFEEFSILWPRKSQLDSSLLKFFFISKYSRHDDAVSTLGVTHCDPPLKNPGYVLITRTPAVNRQISFLWNNLSVLPWVTFKEERETARKPVFDGSLPQWGLLSFYENSWIFVCTAGDARRPWLMLCEPRIATAVASRLFVAFSFMHEKTSNCKIHTTGWNHSMIDS